MTSQTLWHGACLSILGEYENSFLYKDHIFVVDVDNCIFVTNLTSVVGRYWGESAQEMQLADAYLSDNRKLSLDGLVGLYPPEPAVHLLRREVAGRDLHWEHLADITSMLKTHLILDVTVYFDRLYIATTGGLYHFDIQFDSNGTVQLRNWVQRNDAYCLGATVKYSCVAASCGDDGLFVGIDEFDQIGAYNRELRPYGGNSRRTGWTRSNLLNFGKESSLDYYLGTTRQVASAPQSDAETFLMTELEHVSKSQLPDFGLDLERRYEQPRLIFSAESVFAAVSPQGTLRFESRHFTKQDSKFGRSFDAYSAEVGTPYEAFRYINDWETQSHRIVLHTESGIYVVDKDGAQQIFSVPAVSIKTFPSSRRYRNLLCVATEDALHITSPTPPILLTAMKQVQ